MAYVDVPDPNLDAGKPIRSSDIKQLRDNIRFLKDDTEELNRLAIRTDQDIRDHFASNIINSTTVAGSDGPPFTWLEEINNGGTVALVASFEHTAQFDVSAATDHAFLLGADGKQRVAKSFEYVAYFECRVKRTAGNADSFGFGWQDNGLTENSDQWLTDVSDCVLIRRNGTDWEVRTANGGSASSGTLGATATDWNIIRVEFTCSATAGNRKVEAYLNDSLVQTLTTDANMPAALLRPFVGMDHTGTTLQMLVDKIEFGFLTVPVAA